jgi:hypothetical protein
MAWFFLIIPNNNICVYIHIHKFSNLIYLTYPFLTFMYEFLLLAKLNWNLLHMVILCVNSYTGCPTEWLPNFRCLYIGFFGGKNVTETQIVFSSITELCSHVYHKVWHTLATHQCSCLRRAHVPFCMLPLFLHVMAAPSMMLCKS